MRSIISYLAVFGLVVSFGAAVAAAEDGFETIFNGKDLTGWDGDPRFWSVKDGAIRGKTTFQKLAIRNTFLIWRSGVLKSFILKIKFRIQKGNSGIQ